MTGRTPLVVGSAGGLVAVIDPDAGGRILSLTSGAPGSRFEWLAADGGSAPASDAGSIPFVRDGMGGWDEVVPSVSSDVLPSGVVIPDHGDAWNTPWRVVGAEQASASSDRLDSLTLELALTSLPVTLRRTVVVSGAGLELRYSASTTSARPIALLWSAHPQFVATPGSVVAVAVDGVPVHPALVEEYPQRGVSRMWNEVAGAGLPPRGQSLKVFVDPDNHTPHSGEGFAVDSATLRHGAGPALTLAWDAGELPYLGLFWDNAEFAGNAIIALEPSTAFGDSLRAAESAGRVLSVSRQRPLVWALRVSVDA